MSDSDQPTDEPMELSLGDAITAAMKLHQRGRLDEAQQLYERVLEVAPQQADALHFLGLLHHQQGNSDLAVELVQRSTELAPQYADALSNLGNIYKELDRLEEAAAAYERAVRANPGFAPVHNNLGIVLSARGKYRQAEAALRKAIELDANLPSAHDNLCRLLVRVGKSAEALKVATRWNEIVHNDPIAVHTMAALTGDDVPERCSDGYVQKTFDAFAVHYDSVLSLLDNQGPQLISDALSGLLKTAEGDLDILDGGCGTGLCAPVLRPYARSLSGVDLSQGMLDKVPAGSYDELVQAELTAYLAAQSNRFDLIVASDTLNYFGNLEPVLAAAGGALRPDGVLIGTLEHADSGIGPSGIDLQKHGRYRHSRDYVEGVFEKVGLTLSDVYRVTMREEDGEPVAGLLAAARKP